MAGKSGYVRTPITHKNGAVVHHWVRTAPATSSNSRPPASPPEVSRLDFPPKPVSTLPPDVYMAPSSRFIAPGWEPGPRNPLTHDTLGRPREPRSNYSGYAVSDPRTVYAQLREQNIPPVNETFVFHHVTFRYPDANPAPTLETPPRVVAWANHDGVQALVVEVDGSVERPDGEIWHITYSLAPGRKAYESKAMLKTAEWVYLDAPIVVEVEPF